MNMAEPRTMKVMLVWLVLNKSLQAGTHIWKCSICSETHCVWFTRHSFRLSIICQLLHLANCTLKNPFSIHFMSWIWWFKVKFRSDCERNSHLEENSQWYMYLWLKSFYPKHSTQAFSTRYGCSRTDLSATFWHCLTLAEYAMTNKRNFWNWEVVLHETQIILWVKSEWIWILDLNLDTRRYQHQSTRRVMVVSMMRWLLRMRRGANLHEHDKGFDIAIETLKMNYPAEREFRRSLQWEELYRSEGDRDKL